MAKEEKLENKTIKISGDNENVANVIAKKEKNITEQEKDNQEAVETAKKVKKSLIKIKIPVDPLNPKDLVVPVMINGYMWNIKRGETVEVPEAVANILEEAKYI